MDTKVLNIGNVVNEEMLKLLHYFASNTTDRIFEHIKRLEIHETGQLKASIRATVQNMAGGNSALVSFYFLNYGVFVEQAVGKYFGVDEDLGAGRGVRAENISAPQITSPTYGSMVGQIKGISKTYGEDKKPRGEKHRPKPFLMSEIRYQLRKIQWRLLSNLGYTASAHIIKDICNSFDPSGKSTEEFLKSIGWKEV